MKFDTKYKYTGTCGDLQVTLYPKKWERDNFKFKRATITAFVAEFKIKDVYHAEVHNMSIKKVDKIIKDYGFSEERTTWTKQLPEPNHYTPREELNFDGFNDSVYFVHAIGSGRVKIGYAGGKSAGRVGYYRTASPFPTIVIGFIPDAPRKKEREVHQDLSHLHAYGEWYHLNDEMLEYIKSNCRLPKAS